MMETRAEFRSLLPMIEWARIHPLIDSVVPLADAGAAFSRLEAGEVAGKLVVKVSGASTNAAGGNGEPWGGDGGAAARSRDELT